MGLSMKEVSDDDSQVFNNWLQPSSESPKPPAGANKRSYQQLQQAEPLNCPRCNSANTKFCYYNNYNRTQPRHFCKACKRHWTKGGTLRNVPVGGGRKNKRQKTSQPAVIAATIDPPSIPSFYKTMNNIHHLPSFLSHDDNALIYNTESFTSHQPMQFSFSGSNSETEGLLNNIATSFQKLENMEKAVITSINIPGINEAWEFEVPGNYNINTSTPSVMELPSSSHWNWNDFDTTVGDFSMPNWDETDIKP